MTAPPGFYNDAKAQGKVCRLRKSIYGLKQASRQWYIKFSDSHIEFGFKASMNDTSMFTYSTDSNFLVLLVYINDVVITGTSDFLITKVKNYLNDKFSIKDLGHLHYFLGIEVARSTEGLFINQLKYVIDMINEAGLIGCKPSIIPMDPKQKLALFTAPAQEDPTPYRRLVGMLI